MPAQAKDDKGDTMEVDGAAAAGEGDATPETPPRTVVDDLCANVDLLEHAVGQKETQMAIGRLLRQTASARKRMSSRDIRTVADIKLPAGHPAVSAIGPYLSAADDGGMEVDGKANGTSAAAPAAAPTPSPASTIKPVDASALPEAEAYVYLLALMRLLDTDRPTDARDLAGVALDRIATFNRRTLDSIAARVYAYYSLSHERCDSLASIRSRLLALQRTATLRHDEIGQETLLNLLLHNYLHYNLYDHAEKLRSKTQVSVERRNPNQYCRYLYYIGRIRAIQLDYTESKESLQQALRKAPQAAKGFRITLHKWLAMVSLLLGEVPERTHFTVPGMRQALRPYFELAQAIRLGDLKRFKEVASTNDAAFLGDKTHNLVVRLQHNVIRTGLRRLSKAYSKIALSDVAARLALENAAEAELIVAKAIRDGAVDAKLDHARGWMTTSEASDVYATFEPQQAFHSRILFCLNLHNEAVKAKRYKPNEHKESAESAEARKERMQQEQELAKHLQEEDDDF